MSATTNTIELISQLQNISGEENVFADEESLNFYGHDETEKLIIRPMLLLSLHQQKK